MSGWWIVPGQSTVCVDDAVLTGIDCSSIPANIYMMRWWGSSGEILYNHDDRLPVREPVMNFAAFVPVFDKWILAAMDPEILKKTLETSPPITLAQAKAIKSNMAWGLYYNKFAGLTPGAPAGDNTASVNASISGLTASINAVLAAYNASINATINAAINASVAALNQSLSDQAGGHNANVSAVNTNASGLASLSGVSIPSGGGSLPTVTTANASVVSTPAMSGVSIATEVGSVGTTPAQAGSAAISPTDPLAPTRNAHLANIATITTVEAVAAYNVLAGW